jgi:hypothetical protein
VSLRNLAGRSAEEASERVQQELNAAGASQIEYTPDSRDEVRARVAGVVLDMSNGRMFKIIRRWCYWSVSLAGNGPALSVEEATALDTLSYDGPRSHYCGNRGVLGDVVRWCGFAGGHEPATYWQNDIRTQGWHIDTAEGLAAFVQWVRSQCG